MTGTPSFNLESNSYLPYSIRTQYSQIKYDRSVELIQALDNTRDPLASAHACGNDAVLLFQSFHVMHQLDGQLAA
jgi:hypothetical protein